MVPTSIEPMRAVIGELPPADDDRWAYEVKWDGVRAIGFVDAHGAVRLHSSNLIDITRRYPELAQLGPELGGKQAILDGEIVAFNDEGRPDFGLLQRRMHLNGDKLVAEWAARLPIVWVLFDLLCFDGHVLFADKPGASAPTYDERRRLLEGLVDPGPHWQVPAAQIGDGHELLRAVTARGLEGVMAKRRSGVYVPGRRSSDWRKIKVRRRQELVIGGWKHGEGSRSSTIGAFLVGYYDDDGRFACAGRVGSGLKDVDLRFYERELPRLHRDDCPFDPPPTRDERKDAHWVEPELVIEVAFGEWSADGRLRHPSYVGRRTDKDPRDVTRET